MILLYLHLEIKILEQFWTLSFWPKTTFDLQRVDILKTPGGNNKCVLMTSLWYVICKYSDFLNIFSRSFWLYLNPVTPVKSKTTFVPTDLLIFLKIFWWKSDVPSRRQFYHVFDLCHEVKGLTGFKLILQVRARLVMFVTKFEGIGQSMLELDVANHATVTQIVRKKEQFMPGHDGYGKWNAQWKRKPGFSPKNQVFRSKKMVFRFEKSSLSNSISNVFDKQGFSVEKPGFSNKFIEFDKQCFW